MLVAKAIKAAHSESLERIVVAGGVACNQGLRGHFRAMARDKGLQVVFPDPSLCGDNAAMLGVAANYYLKHGHLADWALNARPTWSLDTVSLQSAVQV